MEGFWDPNTLDSVEEIARRMKEYTMTFLWLKWHVAASAYGWLQMLAGGCKRDWLQVAAGLLHLLPPKWPLATQLQALAAFCPSNHLQQLAATCENGDLKSLKHRRTVPWGKYVMLAFHFGNALSFVVAYGFCPGWYPLCTHGPSTRPRQVLWLVVCWCKTCSYTWPI